MRIFKIYSFSKFEVYNTVGGTSGKEPAWQCGRLKRLVLITGWRRSPGGRHGCPLQFSCPENSTDRGAWWATVPGVTKTEAT